MTSTAYPDHAKNGEMSTSYTDQNIDNRLNALPLSVGIGLKPVHYHDVLASVDDQIDVMAPGWVEVHPQNYFGDGGPPHNWLTAIAEHFPLSLHSVGLSMGSADGVSRYDLEKIAALCERYNPASVSDHLSWSGQTSDRYPDLLPIPYTQASLDHFARQIDIVQERLGRTILVENPSRYLGYKDDVMDEIDFIHKICAATGCGLLFDINNVEVSSTNMSVMDPEHQMPDPRDYIDAIDPAIVGEIHLAGHAREDHDDGPLLIDDHGSAVNDLCWSLYERFIARSGPKPTLIEWDTDIPDYAVLMEQVAIARSVMAKALPRVDAA